MANANANAETLVHRPCRIDFSQSHWDFEDVEVIVTTPDDARLAVRSDVPCRYEQSFDGPRFLVISAVASDEQLSKAANLLGLPLKSLIRFRNHHAEQQAKNLSRCRDFGSENLSTRP